MSTIIKDEVGVEMAGPDSPALAAAKAQDVGGEAYLRYTDECRVNGRHPLNHEDWLSRRQPGDGLKVGSLQASQIPPGDGFTEAQRIGDRGVADQVRDHVVGRAVLGTGSAGQVDGRQAGILPTGRINISTEMVGRAHAAAQARGRSLERADVFAMLEAALRG